MEIRRLNAASAPLFHSREHGNRKFYFLLFSAKLLRVRGNGKLYFRRNSSAFAVFTENEKFYFRRNSSAFAGMVNFIFGGISSRLRKWQTLFSAKLLRIRGNSKFYFRRNSSAFAVFTENGKFIFGETPSRFAEMINFIFGETPSRSRILRKMENLFSVKFLRVLRK